MYTHGKRMVPHWRDGPIEPRPGTGANAPPVLADLDSDGDLEIIVMFRNGSIYVLSHKGEVRNGWPQRLGYTPYAAPAVGDLNGDGQIEVVAGDLGTSSIVAFNEDGTLAPGWPISMFSSTVTSTPVLGDINGDGETDVLIATNWGQSLGPDTSLQFRWCRARRLAPDYLGKYSVHTGARGPRQ